MQKISGKLATVTAAAVSPPERVSVTTVDRVLGDEEMADKVATMRTRTLPREGQQ
jgi:hypothetical protein